jgi:hypothetical protein
MFCKPFLCGTFIPQYMGFSFRVSRALKLRACLAYPQCDRESGVLCLSHAGY